VQSAVQTGQDVGPAAPTPVVGEGFDPTWLVVLATVALLAALVSFVWRRSVMQRRVDRRLASLDEDLADVDVPGGAAVRPVLAQGGTHWVGGGAVGLVVFALLAGAFRIDLALALSLAALVGVLVWIALGLRARAYALKVEGQLGDAIDLQIAALRAGASLLDALAVAAREVRRPLANAFGEAVGRLRLGEDPLEVFDDLQQLVPLDSMRLYTQALAVQWETGGSLAPTLASVGAAVRDRVELVRRVKAQASEVEFSVLGVLALTWLIAWISWRTDPGRFEDFVGSAIGASLLALAIGMQAVGLIWVDRLSRTET
jgi:tight adherence protein B